jgi:hypothetical protein
MMDTTSRPAAVALGIRLEVATVVWMAAEAAIAVVVRIMARSVLLTLCPIVVTTSVAGLVAGFRPEGFNTFSRLRC